MNGVPISLSESQEKFTQTSFNFRTHNKNREVQNVKWVCITEVTRTATLTRVTGIVVKATRITSVNAGIVMVKLHVICIKNILMVYT